MMALRGSQLAIIYICDIIITLFRKMNWIIKRLFATNSPRIKIEYTANKDADYILREYYNNRLLSSINEKAETLINLCNYFINVKDRRWISLKNQLYKKIDKLNLQKKILMMKGLITKNIEIQLYDVLYEISFKKINEMNIDQLVLMLWCQAKRKNINQKISLAIFENILKIFIDKVPTLNKLEVSDKTSTSRELNFISQNTIYIFLYSINILNRTHKQLQKIFHKLIKNNLNKFSLKYSCLILNQLCKLGQQKKRIVQHIFQTIKFNIINLQKQSIDTRFNLCMNLCRIYQDKYYLYQKQKSIQEKQIMKRQIQKLRKVYLYILERMVFPETETNEHVNCQKASILLFEAERINAYQITIISELPKLICQGIQNCGVQLLAKGLKGICSFEKNQNVSFKRDKKEILTRIYLLSNSWNQKTLRIMSTLYQNRDIKPADSQLLKKLNDFNIQNQKKKRKLQTKKNYFKQAPKFQCSQSYKQKQKKKMQTINDSFKKNVIQDQFRNTVSYTKRQNKLKWQTTKKNQTKRQNQTFQKQKSQKIAKQQKESKHYSHSSNIKVDFSKSIKKKPLFANKKLQQTQKSIIPNQSKVKLFKNNLTVNYSHVQSHFAPDKKKVNKETSSRKKGIFSEYKATVHSQKRVKLFRKK